ncbi:unnamed protein product [Symbiodinium natans]|uniref:Uncharacterized protein n=1 Tax=Symbiodinium natans TaxID=878477 RepID=A0A812KHZ9_9DINO|nr:unnamed protein product [Symbiodinium natans]
MAQEDKDVLAYFTLDSPAIGSKDNQLSEIWSALWDQSERLVQEMGAQQEQHKAECVQLQSNSEEHQRRAAQLEAAFSQSTGELQLAREAHEATQREKASITSQIEMARRQLEEESRKVEEKDAMIAELQAKVQQHRQREEEQQASSSRRPSFEVLPGVAGRWQAATSESHRCVREALAMRVEELTTKQGDLLLERQRLLGALEESRRAVLNCLGVPNPVAALDSARVAGLEQQLSTERKRVVEQAVALQRAERRVSQLESIHRQGEATQAGQIQRSLNQELQKSNERRIQAELRMRQVQECAAMATEELGTTKLDMIRLRAALDEHRRLQQSHIIGLTRGHGYAS